MEVRTNPGVANRLSKSVAIGDLPQMGEIVGTLMEQPGWQLLTDLLEEHIAEANELLQRAAHKSALSTDPNAAVEYARRVGHLDGTQWVVDAAQTVLAKAKEAAEDLRNQAAAEAAADREVS